MTAPNSGITDHRLPHIDELLACISHAEARASEVFRGARRPPVTEGGYANGLTPPPASHYTHARASDLSQYSLSSREEPSGEQWHHHVPRKYTPAQPDSRPPLPSATSSSVFPPAPPPFAVAPAGPPSPADLWPSAAAAAAGSAHGHQQGGHHHHHHHPHRQDPCRCCHGAAHGQGRYSPRDYRERDYPRDRSHHHPGSDGLYRPPYEGGYSRGGGGGGEYSPSVHSQSSNSYNVPSSGTGGYGSATPDARVATPPLLLPSRGSKKKRPNLPKEAVDLMMAWVDSHIEYPFERADRPDLVQRTKLEEKRVTDWFTNFRRRKWRPHRVDYYTRQVSHWKAAARAAQDEADRAGDATMAEAAARRAREAEAARCAAETNRLRAKDELDRWLAEQGSKKADRAAKRRAGLLVGRGDGDGDGEEEEEDSDEDF